MPSNSGANLGFEDKLWAAADKLRGTMDAAEYKHVVLGLIFLKYISDAFHEKYNALVYEAADPTSELFVADEAGRYEIAEDRDEYLAENVFWVPPEARWPYLQKSAKQASIGQLVDDAMKAIERDNVQLKGVLPKDYARPAGQDPARRADRSNRHYFPAGTLTNAIKFLWLPARATEGRDGVMGMGAVAAQ